MQKSRITWLKLGDQNITFFYKIVQSRTAYNAIRKLVLSTGETITGPIAIKQADASYFAQFLGPDLHQTPTLTDDIPSLSELLDFRCPVNIVEILVHPISEAEIKNVLFAMPSNKAPGPDGYPAEFYRSAWPVNSSDFTITVQSFFMYGFLPQNASMQRFLLSYLKFKEKKF